MIVAAGVPVRTRFAGSTTRPDGATPKLHCIIAPMHTKFAICSTSLLPMYQPQLLIATYE